MRENRREGSNRDQHQETMESLTYRVADTCEASVPVERLTGVLRWTDEGTQSTPQPSHERAPPESNNDSLLLSDSFQSPSNNPYSTLFASRELLLSVRMQKTFCVVSPQLRWCVNLSVEAAVATGSAVLSHDKRTLLWAWKTGRWECGDEGGE
jgi:hypothetical protein